MSEITIKPKVFIGSSQENIDIAYKIQTLLSEQDDCETLVWNQGVFRPNYSSLDNLIQTVPNFDFGVFVFAPDDSVTIRDENWITVRDNIVFELGLFFGHLGRERTFFIIPKCIEQNTRIPSDLLGINTLKYYYHQGRNITSALAPVCNQIRDLIRQNGCRSDRIDIERFKLVQIQKDVYTYVFNRLNPYQNLSLSQDFLKNLPLQFNSIDDVLYPLDTLINNYVKNLIKPWMRIYYAYALDKNFQYQLNEFTAYYRIGISYSENDQNWIEGTYAGNKSNIHKAYTGKRISKVKNAKHNIHNKSEQNQYVENEGSVVAFPIFLQDNLKAEDTECIGVIALSSPHIKEVTYIEYVNLVQELSIIFSALFYAYRHQMQSENQTITEIAATMRHEICGHFELNFRNFS